MDLEDMQVIWDSQREQRAFAIDEDALHKVIRRRGKQIGRLVGHFEIMMIGIMSVVGIATLTEPLIQRHDFHQLPGGALALLVAAYLSMQRARRLRSEHGFDRTILGDLDKAIYQIDYQIGRLKTFLWWFIVPLSIGSIISLIVGWGAKPVWIWPVTALAMVVAWLAMRRDLKSQLPRKRELEKLRRTIVSTEEGS